MIKIGLAEDLEQWDADRSDRREKTAANDRGEFCRLGPWVDQLADELKGSRVLEIMAGTGHLAARLVTVCEIDIRCTDDFSWLTMHGRVEQYPVESLTALDAIVKYPDSDILLCVWPYWDDDDFTQACIAWGSDREIVYIGEDKGGLTADDSFFEGFKADRGINMNSYNNIYDSVHIGRFTPCLT